MYILVYFTELWLRTYNPDFFNTTSPSIHFEAPRIVSCILHNVYEQIRKHNGQARKYIKVQHNFSQMKQYYIQHKAYVHASYYFIIFKYEYSLFNYVLNNNNGNE